MSKNNRDIQDPIRHGPCHKTDTGRNWETWHQTDKWQRDQNHYNPRGLPMILDKGRRVHVFINNRDTLRSLQGCHTMQYQHQDSRSATYSGCLERNPTRKLEYWPTGNVGKNGGSMSSRKAPSYSAVRGQLQLLQPIHLWEGSNGLSQQHWLHARGAFLPKREYKQRREVQQDTHGQSFLTGPPPNDIGFSRCSILLQQSKLHYHVTSMAGPHKRKYSSNCRFSNMPADHEILPTNGIRRIKNVLWRHQLPSIHDGTRARQQSSAAILDPTKCNHGDSI